MYNVRNKNGFAEFELSEFADAFKLYDTLGDGNDCDHCYLARR